MSSTDHSHDHHSIDPGAPKRPFGGRRRLVNVIDVRFASTFTLHACDVGDLAVRRGDKLVVDTTRGPLIGSATGVVERRVLPTQEIRRIIRKADAADLEAWAECESLKQRAMKAAAIELRALRLPMKIVQIEYTLDRSRAVFYFSSDEKPEFRTLARNLAQRLNVRVDLRQLGVRDGTGLIGGIGPCGHELCCSLFLRHFATISMRFAKDQGLTLNPTRITGMCGRLKCCLVYEQPVYKELRQFAPRARTGVLTPAGPGNILEVDTLARRVLVGMYAGAMATFHLRDCVVLDAPLSHADIEASMTRTEDVLARSRQRRGGVTTENRQKPARAVSADLGGDEYIWESTEAGSESLTVDGRSEAPAARTKDAPRRRNDGAPRPGAPSRREGQARRPDGRPDGRPGQPQQAGQPARGKPGVDATQVAARPAGEGESANAKKRRRKKKRAGGGSEAPNQSIEAGANANPGADVQRPQRTPPESSGWEPSDGDEAVAAAAGGEQARRKRRRRRGKGAGGGAGGDGGGGSQGGGEGSSGSQGGGGEGGAD